MRSSFRVFTLIELMITMSIFIIVAAMGINGMDGAKAQWQTRSAALKLKADVDRCRAIAVKADNYCRIQLGTIDSSPTTEHTGSATYGRYQIQYCNGTEADYLAATCWDTLPIDAPDAGGTEQWDGDIEYPTDARWPTIIGFGGEAKNSIDWSAPDINDHAIVFNNRGLIENPANTYTELGYLYIEIADKYQAMQGKEICYQLQIGNGAQYDGGTTVLNRLDSGCHSW